ncbi:BLUF domain-containing protein [uncultured Mucilaginibacter sp.]|uniref:BLUF domain-containing protein n=1 Tax=uncultured Mucilaginibacter sp. TaxID=797541 RepID=UPI002612F207|nr:BLUF domain-containing protein [uncultured Mucilaginibacter sp.]
MYFLIYTSYALQTNGQALKALLQQAREKNKRQAVTGMLLYLNGIFIQLIEGGQKEVQQLYQTIRKDNRHKEAVVLKEGAIEKRYFTDWSMGFKAVSAEELAHEEGYKCLNGPGQPDIQSVLKVFELLAPVN